MNTQQIKSGKANGRLHFILSVCIAMALIIGASAINLFQSPIVQAAVSADLASPSQDNEKASGKISMASIPAGTTGEISVPVMLTDAKNIGVISAKISYDASKLTPKSCLTDGTNTLCKHNFGKGVVSFNATHINGFEGTVKLNEFVFEMLESSETDLSFEFDITTSASSGGETFELGVLEGTPLSLVSERKMFLPLVQK